MADERVPTFCALCVSRCGATAVLRDGAFVALEPDPGHPTGRALCAKGKAAPELVYHPERLNYPLKRTRPKSDSDPGWQCIGWDEALNEIAARLLALRDRYGARRVVLAGSLARGDFRVGSDIDLAAEGIPDDQFFRAGADLEASAGGLRVDLVPLESANPDYLADLAREGIVLHDQGSR